MRVSKSKKAFLTNNHLRFKNEPTGVPIYEYLLLRKKWINTFCGTETLSLLENLSKNDAGLVVSLVSAIPEVKDLLYQANPGAYTCPSAMNSEQLASMISAYRPQEAWEYLEAAYGTGAALEYYKSHYPEYFIS